MASSTASEISQVVPHSFEGVVCGFQLRRVDLRAGFVDPGGQLLAIGRAQRHALQARQQLLLAVEAGIQVIDEVQPFAHAVYVRTRAFDVGLGFAHLSPESLAV
ncbi:hypothetical protein KSS94_21590 [Pseudomonas fakonensis]|uniref:Uncharacterized protein n=1 Tax=Pseudomonas fakonensis TaxID=2842355 RepID=A0ABX8N2D8_9PSED|nr:hypothetical protein [Pseudomonas fakonensis]QXH50512.1 hypothetical protein KSS94_21590 [Pseudomonas fakonensis]